MTWFLAHLWPLCFLTVAVIDDLVFRKFHNALFLILTALAIFYAVQYSDLSWQQSLLGFVVGGLTLLPLVLFGAIGAGDMKFMMAFGILMGSYAIFWIFIYALFWGACIGILKALFSGEITQVFWRTFGFLHKLKPEKTQKIPFTVAIAFGWLSWLQLGGLS